MPRFDPRPKWVREYREGEKAAKWRGWEAEEGSTMLKKLFYVWWRMIQVVSVVLILLVLIVDWMVFSGRGSTVMGINHVHYPLAFLTATQFWEGERRANTHNRNVTDVSFSAVTWYVVWVVVFASLVFEIINGFWELLLQNGGIGNADTYINDPSSLGGCSAWPSATDNFPYARCGALVFFGDAPVSIVSKSIIRTTMAVPTVDTNTYSALEWMGNVQWLQFALALTLFFQWMGVSVTSNVDSLSLPQRFHPHGGADNGHVDNLGIAHFSLTLALLLMVMILFGLGVGEWVQGAGVFTSLPSPYYPLTFYLALAVRAQRPVSSSEPDVRRGEAPIWDADWHTKGWGWRRLLGTWRTRDCLRWMRTIATPQYTYVFLTGFLGLLVFVLSILQVVYTADWVNLNFAGATSGAFLSEAGYEAMFRGDAGQNNFVSWSGFLTWNHTCSTTSDCTATLASHAPVFGLVSLFEHVMMILIPIFLGAQVAVYWAWMWQLPQTNGLWDHKEEEERERLEKEGWKASPVPPPLPEAVNDEPLTCDLEEEEWGGNDGGNKTLMEEVLPVASPYQ